MKYSILLLLSAFAMHSAQAECDFVPNVSLSHEGVKGSLFKTNEGYKKELNERFNAMLPTQYELAAKIIDNSEIPNKKVTEINLPVVGKTEITQHDVAKKIIRLLLEIAKGKENINQGQAWINAGKAVIYEAVKDKAFDKAREYFKSTISQINNALPIPAAVRNHKFYWLVDYVANRTAAGEFGKVVDKLVGATPVGKYVLPT